MTCKAASVETPKGRSLPAPKGRPERAEVAQLAFHAQFFPILSLYVSASCIGGIWKSNGSARTKAPRVDGRLEGRWVGSPEYGRGAATTRQCPRRAGPDSHQKEARASTVLLGEGGPRRLFLFSVIARW